MGLEFNSGVTGKAVTAPDFTTVQTGAIVPGATGTQMQLRPANVNRRYLQARSSFQGMQFYLSFGAPTATNAPGDAVIVESGETFVMSPALGNLFVGEIWVQMGTIGAGMGAIGSISWIEAT